MAAPSREAMRAAQNQKPGVHTRGLGRCPECGSRQLRVCTHCGKRSMHNVGAWSPYREEACENGCTTIERSGYVTGFQAEMKEALYQFDLAEAQRRGEPTEGDR